MDEETATKWGGKKVLWIGSVLCKGPKVRACLVCLRKRKKAWLLCRNRAEEGAGEGARALILQSHRG